jgi:hypothetical protein
METSLGPGPDNRLGTADDVRTPLTTYTREIMISDIITNGVPNPNLRQLQVMVTYTVGRNRRTYTLTTFVSSIS